MRDVDVVGLDEPAFAEHDGALDDVAQLARVARPVVVEQPALGLGREALDRSPRALAHAAEEEASERKDVLAALGEGREVNADHLEAVVEVLAETPVLHELLEVAVSGGDETQVHGDLVLAADADEPALLEHPQQLHLRVESQLAHLVEEERPSPGELNLALAPLVRAGEGAFLVPEQLGIDERRRERAAVDVDERPVASRTASVDQARDDFLSRAGGARHEDGRVGRRRLLDQLEAPLALGALGEEDDSPLAARLGRRCLREIARRRVVSRRLVGDERLDLDPGLSDRDLVAFLEARFLDALAVEERSVARAEVAQDQAAVARALEDAVAARDSLGGEDDLARPVSTERRVLLEDVDALGTGAVLDDQGVVGVRHGRGC